MRTPMQKGSSIRVKAEHADCLRKFQKKEDRGGENHFSRVQNTLFKADESSCLSKSHRFLTHERRFGGESCSKANSKA